MQKIHHRVAYTATTNQTPLRLPFEFFSTADVRFLMERLYLRIMQVQAQHPSILLLVLLLLVTVLLSLVLGVLSLSVATGATNGDIITIIRDITIERTSDFPVSGSFDITSLNTDLDRIYAKLADVKQQYR